MEAKILPGGNSHKQHKKGDRNNKNNKNKSNNGFSHKPCLQKGLDLPQVLALFQQWDCIFLTSARFFFCRVLVTFSGIMVAFGWVLIVFGGILVVFGGTLIVCGGTLVVFCGILVADWGWSNKDTNSSHLHQNIIFKHHQKGLGIFADTLRCIISLLVKASEIMIRKIPSPQ